MKIPAKNAIKLFSFAIAGIASLAACSGPPSGGAPSKPANSRNMAAYTQFVGACKSVEPRLLPTYEQLFGVATVDQWCTCSYDKTKANFPEDVIGGVMSNQIGLLDPRYGQVKIAMYENLAACVDQSKGPNAQQNELLSNLSNLLRQDAQIDRDKMKSGS